LFGHHDDDPAHRFEFITIESAPRSAFTMMILRTAPASPFGRKVVIAANVLGLDGDVTIQRADTTDPADTMRRQNPLGKIPILILEDGTTLFDSRVIVDYLDHRAGGGRIIPAEPAARFAALTLQALCDGLMDAALLQVYEGRWRSADRHDAKWMEHQADKVARALSRLEADPPAQDPVPHIGAIALACALGYQDLRFAGRWRAHYPRLVVWLDAFERRVPAFAATRIAA
jgi:glutathione S-transferase